MAVRAAMLLLAALLVLAAAGGLAHGVQPSLLRLEVTATLALLAPLCWPGLAATPKRTALRILVWSAAVACAAGVAIRLLGHAGQAWSLIAPSCATLALIVALSLAAAALLEAYGRRGGGDADGAGEAAGRNVALALALLGSLPLWLGPVGELLSAEHEGAVDAVIGASPLTHLAVACGNDLLRNQWLYQTSNLAALQFAYPGRGDLAWFYAGAALALGALLWLARRNLGAATPVHSTSEKAPS